MIGYPSKQHSPSSIHVSTVFYITLWNRDIQGQFQSRTRSFSNKLAKEHSNSGTMSFRNKLAQEHGNSGTMSFSNKLAQGHRNSGTMSFSNKQEPDHSVTQ